MADLSSSVLAATSGRGNCENKRIKLLSRSNTSLNSQHNSRRTLQTVLTLLNSSIQLGDQLGMRQEAWKVGKIHEEIKSRAGRQLHWEGKGDAGQSG